MSKTQNQMGDGQNVKKLAGRLYRQSYQQASGYQDIYYDEETDKVHVAYFQQNSWDNDPRTIRKMPCYVTPKKCFEIAEEILPEIEERKKAFMEVEN